MKNIPYVSFMFRPQIVREVATERAEIAAVVVNAINGMFVVGAIAFSMQTLFTMQLIILLAILFGPLAGFVISSAYSRVELTVGRRLGGDASLDGIYRLFAWAFLPASFALLLYGLILPLLEGSSATAKLLAAIPSLVIICCAIRNYWANIIACQKFTRIRGSVSVILTFVLFLIIMVAGAGFLSLLFKYGVGGSLNSTSALFSAM